MQAYTLRKSRCSRPTQGRASPPCTPNTLQQSCILLCCSKPILHLSTRTKQPAPDAHTSEDRHTDQVLTAHSHSRPALCDTESCQRTSEPATVSERTSITGGGAGPCTSCIGVLWPVKLTTDWLSKSSWRHAPVSSTPDTASHRHVPAKSWYTYCLWTHMNAASQSTTHQGARTTSHSHVTATPHKHTIAAPGPCIDVSQNCTQHM
jgi:hypothetical protein